VISKQRVLVDPTKVEVALEWELQKIVTEIHSFLGLARYCRRFIKEFLRIVMPLTQLIKKCQILEWTEKYNNSF